MNEEDKTISKWGVKVVTFDRRTDAYKAELLETARMFRDLFKAEFGIDLFVSYGVLLGFARNGDFIGHDDDFDFAYISPQRKKAEMVAESARIIETLIDKGFDVYENSFGQYKVWMRREGKIFKFEIFVGWREGENAFLYFGIDQPVPLSIFLPLRAHRFFDDILPIPNQPEAVCEAIYGKNWRTPDPNFRYALTAEQWRRFAFLFTSVNRQHWNTYYKQRSKGEPWSVLPSQFAAFVANETSPGRLLEVGCGNGRDSLFFSSVNFDVTATDYSTAAIELCKTRSEESGYKLTLDQLNVYDLSHVMRFISESKGAFDVVYARFFLHAITELGERNFWRFCLGVLKVGGKCFVEFRTDQDKRAEIGVKISENERSDGHYRRFMSLDQVRSRAESFGLKTRFATSGTGMAAFRGEDPHIGRLVMERIA